MKISALVQNGGGQHEVTLRTNGSVQPLAIPPRPNGFGSSVNGGELLFLALATCYCNGVYREAAKRGLSVERVEVEVEAARNVTYHVKLTALGSEAELRELLCHTDRVAEIQNTLRAGIAVTLSRVEVVVG